MPVGRIHLVDDIQPLALERGWRYVEHTPAGVQEAAPSVALPDEPAHLAGSRGEYVSLHQGLTRRGRSRPDIERLYRRLVHGMRYGVPPTFTCEVPHALVLSETGLVVTEKGEALVQSCLYGGAAGAKLALVRASAERRVPVPLQGTYVSLLSYDARNYAHWLQDCLPRLALLPPSAPVRVLVPPDSPPFVHESLALLGVAAEDVVEAPPAVIVERLVLAHASGRTNRAVAAHLLALRKRILAAAGTASATPTRRLFAARAGPRRRIANERELAEVLRDAGFEIVHCHELPFAEQVRLFAEAEAIAGAHGAALHNHLWAAPGIAIAELFGPAYLYLTVFRTASIARQRHHHLVGAPAGGQYDVRVDRKRLGALLALAGAGPDQARATG